MAQTQSKKSFKAYTVLICILGIVLMFFYSGLQNDQINIIQTFSGWTNSQTMLPMTIGNLACILLTFAYGTWFMKKGLRKTMVPIMIITAIGCLGIAAANGIAHGDQIASGNVESGSYALYFISLFVVRCGCMIFQMGGFQLVSNWFIRRRGSVMGIVTVGSPLFSVIGTSFMTRLIQNNFNGDYRPFYVGIAVLIVVITLVLWFGLKDTPEEVGLYPDGASEAPKSEKGIQEEAVEMSVKQVLSMKKSWQLIISYGIFTFIINACMGSMAARYMSLSTDPSNPAAVWMTALTYLSIGALLGIPMSYVFGIIDDKCGSIVASVVLGLCELLPVFGLMLQPQGGSVPLMVLWGFGVACMTGGVPTMHPCITAYLFGRKEYASASRIIMAIQLIPSAFAGQMMVSFIGAGNGRAGYILLMVLIIIALITIFTMRNIPDANASERDYGKKQAE